jgi:hypothetical protein
MLGLSELSDCVKTLIRNSQVRCGAARASVAHKNLSDQSRKIVDCAAELHCYFGQPRHRASLVN